MYVLEKGPGQLTLAEVRSPEWQARFFPYPELLKKYPPTSGGRAVLNSDSVYWGRILIQNRLKDPSVLQNWVLFTGTSNFTKVYLVAPGRIDSMLTGTLTPAHVKNFNFANDTSRVQFSLPDTGVAELYVRLQVTDGRPIWFDVRLAQRDFFENWNFVIKTRSDWLFIGFLLTLFFVHLLFYFASKDLAFLLHAVFQAGIFFYLLEFFDVMSDVPVLRNHPEFVQSSLFLALCVMDVAYLQFIRVYMRLWKLLPRWDRIFQIMSWARVALFLAALVVTYGFSDTKLAEDIIAGYMIASYLFLMPFLWTLYRTGDKKGYFVIGGTLFFILGVLLNAWSVIKGFGLQAVYTQIGVFGEIALFTWGLGYRMKVIRQEEAEMLRLKELDEFKSKFYTNITHEFRTPLTVIRGMAEQLKPHFENTKNSKLGEATELIERNAGTLLQLINRILDLSKLEAGKMSVHYQRGNVVDYLVYLTNAFQSFAATHDVQLRFLTDLEELDMDYDAEKLQIIMSNLLSNAMKFTPAGGRISVLVKRVSPEGVLGDQLKIVVKDTGAGIPAASLVHIFDRFFQAKEGGNPAGGSGVGLTLTRELVELMDGQVSVTSEVGVGTEFTILLPVTRLAQPAGVEDTPLQQHSYKGCPAHPQTTCGSNDMFMNFMDYVDDGCMVMYTQGQMERMLATVEMFRPGLMNSEIPCIQNTEGINSEEFTVYPNPASREVKIRFKEPVMTNGLVSISNSIGQLVQQERRVIFDGMTVVLPDMPTGIYCIRIGHKSNKIMVR